MTTLPTSPPADATDDLLSFFDEPVERRGTNSYKWDSSPRQDILPLWVADMDFRTAPPITQALSERVQHGIFGYTRIPERYYETIREWYLAEHHWEIPAGAILDTTGVVPAISAILKAMTQPGDGILVLTPVYNCFYSSIRNLGCRLVPSPLKPDGTRYVIDFERLEEQAADPGTRLMLLCNPHNPVGRVWTREELNRLADLCLRHGLSVISDEIHGELVMPGHRYTPFASLNRELPEVITCLSPSKAFNLAGLQIASIVTASAELRERINRAINIHEVCDVNPFGVIATIAAYRQGKPWLQGLLAYLAENYRTLQRFFLTHLPQFPVYDLEGTYLAWVDCRSLGESSLDSLQENLLEQTGLWLNDGQMYGPEGRGFLRWNLACPNWRLRDALKRFETFVQAHVPN